MAAAASCLWLRLRNVSPLRMLQLEEAIFRADRRSWLVTNQWDRPRQPLVSPSISCDAPLTGDGDGLISPAAIVLGISGKPEELVDVGRASAVGMPLVKRFSGGGTVVVDEGTLFVSFICAGGALPEVQPYPDPILHWSAEVYNEAIKACGVDTFNVQANDYCIADRKFGGNAQSISGKRWLHHTSLLWDYEPERMSLLRMPTRQPGYRAKRTHEDFVRGLGDSLSSRDEFSTALVEAVRRRFALREVGLDETAEALRTPHRKVTTRIA